MSDSPSTESVSRRSVIKTSALAITGITGLSVGSGLGAAEEGETDNKDESESKSKSDEETCFPPKLDIEVKPGNGGQQDPINPNSKGVIPVAVLQTEAFDPTERKVDYRFDAAEKVGCDSAEPVHGGHVEDVDDDGDDDLVLHFDAEETNFAHGDEKAELLWVESEGDHGGESEEEGKSREKCTCRGLSGTDEVKIVGKPNDRGGSGKQKGRGNGKQKGRGNGKHNGRDKQNGRGNGK
ncbi:MAG: hypothetical protein ABEH81_08605 [Halopenitus sp.]